MSEALSLVASLPSGWQSARAVLFPNARHAGPSRGVSEAGGGR